MFLKCVARIFSLEPKANTIETSIIAVLILSALLSSMLAMSDTIAAFYSSVVSDHIVVGSR